MNNWHFPTLVKQCQLRDEFAGVINVKFFEELVTFNSERHSGSFKGGYLYIVSKSEATSCRENSLQFANILLSNSHLHPTITFML